MTDKTEKKIVKITEGEVEETLQQTTKREEKIEALGSAHKTAGTTTEKPEREQPEEK